MEYFGKYDNITTFAESLNRTRKGSFARDPKDDPTFIGIDSAEKADNLLLYGDTETAKKITTFACKQTPQSIKTRIINAPYGFVPNVPRFLSGRPDNMYNVKAQTYKNTKVLNLVYFVGANWEIKADDLYIIINKPYTEKSFCFGYSFIGQRQTYDEAQKQYDSFNGDTFKAENLKSFDEDFPHLKEGESLYYRILQNSHLTEYNKQEASIINEVNYKKYRSSEFVKLEKEIAKPFIKAYNDTITKLRDKYEKQLDTYLKKYGISKLKIWTYCCDD